MGIGPGYRHKMSNDSNNNYTNIDPIPSIFSIKRIITINNNCMVWINYPNCINYEGNKILIYKKISEKTILSQNKLDPHFSTEFISPFIRIEPTEIGWQTGLRILETF